MFALPVFAREWRDIRNETDRDLPPRMQYYNKLKGKPKLLPWETDDPESLNVRMVGKWGRGPAASVTGRDSLILLGLGSEVAIFNAADGSNPRIINEIQCRYVVDRVIVKDNLLYAVLQGGIEVFDITDPARAFRIKYLPISVVDMCIRDTLAYTIDADSFKVYRIVSPESLARVGACADSGYYITEDSGFAYLCDRWGLFVVDATNPASPHRASAVSAGAANAVWVEGGYCYYTEHLPSAAFRIADVSDPYRPVDVGRRDGIEDMDLCKIDLFVYLPGFQILDVSVPSAPTSIGSVPIAGDRWSIWTRTPFSHGFVASGYEGMVVVDIGDPVHPARDTTVAGAAESNDIRISGLLACVANDRAGMKVLETANPTDPRQIGSYDTSGQLPYAQAVAARDSLACLAVIVSLATNFRVISLSDPRRPTLIAARAAWGYGRAIVLRDSLAYVAEDYRFEIFSIANPRAPRLVGSCGLPNSSFDLFIRDTLACVANLTSLQIISIANPAVPIVIGECSVRAIGVAIKDTFALVAGVELYTVSIANPIAPYIAATCTTPQNAKCVAIEGMTAFVGECPYTSKLRVFDISDPTLPVQTGFYSMPGHVWRVECSAPYVYAACLDAGVCILDTIQAASADDQGASEERSGLTIEVRPNLLSSEAELIISGLRSGLFSIGFSDVVGRELFRIERHQTDQKGGYRHQLELDRLPRGVCLITVRQEGKCKTTKMLRL